MEEEKQLMQHAIQALKTRDKEQARKCLFNVLGISPLNDQAWMYLAFTADDVTQGVKYLKRALEINPANDRAKQMLEKASSVSATNKSSEDNQVAIIQSIAQTKNTKKCPYCAEMINAEATVCRYCGRDLVKQSKENQSSSSGGKTLATIGVICGGIGFLAFGLPLGAISVLCGIVALALGEKSGSGAIIIGIIDIVLAILIWNSMY